MVKIINDKKNELFNRREVRFEAEAEVVPSKADALKMVVEQTKAGENFIVIKNVLGKFGSKVFTIVAFVYDSAEAKELNEPRKKEKKK